MNLSDAHTSILCYAHTHKLTYMHTYRHKCIQIAFMYDHRFHFLCSKLQVQIHNSMMGGGVQPHFCPWKNVCFPIFSHGENGEKSIWKEREINTFPFLSIYFFSHFSPWGKNGKTHIFPWAKMGLDPSPNDAQMLYLVSTNTNTHPYSNLHSYIH